MNKVYLFHLKTVAFLDKCLEAGEVKGESVERALCHQMPARGREISSPVIPKPKASE